MILSYKGLQDRASWEAAGVRLPKHDWRAMVNETERCPVWVHFGAGNIFRIFIAGLQQRLLDANDAHAGIVAVETFDPEVIEKIYKPHDSMTLAVSLLADGSIDKAVVASIARGILAAEPEGMEALRAIFRNQSLQMVSFTITEKGYALRDMKGDVTPVAAADIENGPSAPRHAMGVTAALLLERWHAGGTPIAVVSMDNCSHNGEKLKAGVVEIARAWQARGFVPAAFIDWLEDEAKVSFPWSMIDKITPRPSEAVAEQLAAQGIEAMAPIVTEKHTYIAPFVNAEAPQYLVIEDRFPNGRPALEKAGVYMTDRDTVNRTERMKVTTCLNPLHTALAVYGCLLGYEKICDEMKDAELVELIRRIGYVEGLPVVTDPGILSPKAFIDEVVEKRLPNPFMPDTPQRIACDTSQKVPIRYGETIKSYLADPDRDSASLEAIPLAIAGWLRYLLGVDDAFEPMPVSPDPMLSQLQEALDGIRPGDPQSVGDRLDAILSNPNLFGVSLVEAGLDEKVKRFFGELIAGPGAVRATLKRHLNRQKGRKTMLNLNFKPEGTYRYDAVSLGEIMLRLDPGEGRIRTAREFKVWEGGGEYNVVRGLHKCFGLRTGVLTAFANNEVGRLLKDLIEQGGVDTDLIYWKKTDGIGRVCRNGLNFTERGYGIRGAVGCSDRANTAISQARPEDFDFERVFGELGVRWLHTGGIYAALSEQSCETVIEACKTAKKYGTLISYDLNYRPSMWSAIGGLEKCREVNREVAKYVDVMIGNEEDFTACLGLKVEGNDEGLKALNLDGYYKMIEEAARQFPNFKAIATTLRTVRTATINDWKAICWADGEVHQSKPFDGLEVLDRVGGGDSFASGLIYGLMTTGDPDFAVNCGAAHGALAMTTPGDTSMASLEEVEAVMKGSGARVKR